MEGRKEGRQLTRINDSDFPRQLPGAVSEEGSRGVEVVVQTANGRKTWAGGHTVFAAHCRHTENTVKSVAGWFKHDLILFLFS